MRYTKGSPEREGLEGEWPPEVLDLLAAIDERDAEIERLRAALYKEHAQREGLEIEGERFRHIAEDCAVCAALAPEATARREWVVCDDDDNIIFRGHDVAALVEKARAMGVQSPLVKHTPEADDDPR